jgi:hypothetical protein
MTAFRTVFARHGRERDTPGSGSTLVDYVLRLFGKKKETSHAGETNEGLRRGPILEDIRTGGTLKGLRTFIRRFDRKPGETTLQDSTGDSTLDPLESYHHFKKQEEESDVKEWRSA